MKLPINKIICGDNCEVMKNQIPDESIDLVVTSPPYDNLRDYKGHQWDFEGLVKEMIRVIKPGGVIVWVVNDATVDGSETGTSFRQAIHFIESGLNLHDTMIYHRVAKFPETVRYYPEFEYMFILSKGAPNTVNLISDRKNKYAGKIMKGDTQRAKDGTMVASSSQKKNSPIKEYSVRGNVWWFSNGFNLSTRDKVAFKHPAIFPEALARDHILSWSNEGDVVLDPFSGSGTTAKMAKHNGRKYIGIDASQDYCKIAENRLAQDVLF